MLSAISTLAAVPSTAEGGECFNLVVSSHGKEELTQ